ncbi:MAG: hypothetical protein ABSF46_12145 [Terriglobia bacterium]|jgi:hypothetical protein
MKNENPCDTLDLACAAQQVLDAVVGDFPQHATPRTPGREAPAAKEDGKPRRFFPQGITLIDVTVGFGTDSVEVKISGPAASATQAPMRPVTVTHSQDSTLHRKP